MHSTVTSIFEITELEHFNEGLIDMFGQIFNKFYINLPFSGFSQKNANLQLLLYHRILNVDEIDFLSGMGMVHTGTKNFEDHLKWLKNNKYNVINFDQLSNILKNESSIPKRTIILTFDDASLDQYVNAIPLLKKYEFSATFFPIKDCIDNNGKFWLIEFYLYLKNMGIRRVSEILRDLPRLPPSVFTNERLPHFRRKPGDSVFEFKYLLSPKDKELGLQRLRKETTLTREEIAAFCQRYMNSDQIKSLVEDGFEIGSHGIHHYPMICLTEEEKRIEMEKTWIEKMSSKGKKIFSLPFGSHSLSDLELLKDYDFILTTRHEIYTTQNFGRELGRFAIEDEPVRKLSKRIIR